MKRLDDFVPMGHPLRAIREMVNKALVAMNDLFADMYEADIKGGRPSVAPEKLLRAHAVAGALQRALRAHSHGTN